MCNNKGTIIDDLLIYRLSSTKFLLVVNAACRQKDLLHIKEHLKGDVYLDDKSDETGQLALQGPLAKSILARCTIDDPANLKSFFFTETETAGKKVLISRTGYTGEDGFEIYCSPNDIVTIFDEIMKAGAKEGLVPVGLGARDTLRLESRLMLYGNDITEETTPLEAGLKWTVDFNKEQFMGKEALLKQRKTGITRKLMGFEMVDRAIGRHGYPAVAADSKPDALPVGHVTSGAPSPTLGKNIGLCYLPKKYYKTGSVFGIVIRGKVKTAKVVKTPFYKRPVE
jgi:aminomethyltransferase